MDSVAQADQYDHHSISKALSDAAAGASKRSDYSAAKFLWDLSDAASMMLKAGGGDPPFNPMISFSDGRRSALPEDFSLETLALFSAVIEEIDHPWLRARIADLLWCQQKLRDHRHAVIAVEAYSGMPITDDEWIGGTRECFGRAARLARTLRESGRTYLHAIAERLANALLTREVGADRITCQIAQVLQDNNLCRQRAGEIAEKLEAVGRALEAKSELMPAIDHLQLARDWYKRADAGDKSCAMSAAVAELWARNADERMRGPSPSNMVAASFFENAVQEYRRIPKTHRATYRADERIAQLRVQMNTAGSASLLEMATIDSGPMDVSKLVEAAQGAIKGRQPLKALMAFAAVATGFKVVPHRESVIKMAQESPLHMIMGATHVSGDGRVVAKRPALDPTLPPSADPAIWAEMIKNYGITVALAAQAQILPALDILRFEHRFHEDDFVVIAQHSPIVPRHRERIFAKGLHAGYSGDFTSAIHLLTPQVEHLVRVQLKRRSVATTTVDETGIENEIGLTALMEKRGVVEFFGEDLAFEIRALFCDPFGANLRNEIAHGLFDDADCHSIFTIYAWWLTLSLVVRTYRAAQQTERSGDDAARAPSNHGR